MYKAKHHRKDAGSPRSFMGRKVEDGSETLSFVVTETDRKRGKINDPCKCAAALAIRRTYPGKVKEVYVCRSCTFVVLENKVIRYSTSHGLRDQLLRFDAGAKKFDVGTYRVNPPSASQIANRGKQHSPPDRAHGAADSPHARKKPLSLRHHVGRPEFHFQGSE